MAPCVEILKLTASDAYKADASVLDPVAQFVAEAPGSIIIYSGLDVNEPQYLWVIVAWESLQAHQDLIDNKEIYPKLLEGLFKAASKIEFMHHVTFSADISDALASPVTELGSWELHDSTDPKQFTPLETSVIDKVYELAGEAVHKGGLGLSHETGKNVFVCLGWNSVEEFKATLPRLMSEMDSTITQMKELATLRFGLAKLTKYERK